MRRYCQLAGAEEYCVATRTAVITTTTTTNSTTTTAAAAGGVATM